MTREKLDNCGCCEGTSKETPLKVYNRPNLPAIAYRVGNHTQFKESLLTALSNVQLTALHGFTTRSDDDFTIALLDAWAVVSDVLTFYQERIANESYLGTATEQLSIVELARLIGYELRPGVAASTPLAFTIEEATLALGQIAVTGNTRGKEDIAPTLIPIGSKVQSIPGPDEEPQTYETVEKIEARPEWNAMKPRTTQPQQDFTHSVVVKGTANDLKLGDILLIRKDPSVNLVKKVVKVILDQEAQTTTLLFDLMPLSQNEQINSFSVGVLSNIAAKTTLDQAKIEEIANQSWTADDMSALIKSQNWSKMDVMAGFAKQRTKAVGAVHEVFVFRKHALPFGYNALKHVDYYGDNGALLATPIFRGEWPIARDNNSDYKIYLESAYEQVVAESYVAVTKETGETTVYKVQNVDIRPRTEYGISAKSTVITTAQNTQWWTSNAGNNIGALRSIVIHVQSEPLVLLEADISTDIQGDTFTLDGFFLGLTKNQPIIVFGERTDLKGAYATEFRLLKDVFFEKGFTKIILDKPLIYQYIRKTVTVNANIANATHGETVKEVLGSGDARKAFQKFILKQPPLTFTSAATPSGTQSTLEIRVNDLLWHEVPSLFERKPNEHVYITRQDDLGKTTVIFGDGKNGARLPTGQENIRATYRKGIGVKGLLKAHQLSQLLSRPLGAKAVTNPFNTEGSQDREALADARQNATLTMFTLGRIVSLKDYEDFARAFAGIAKALSTWTWQGNKRCIFLTVAGYNGATVAESSQLYGNLLNAIHSSGIPNVPVYLKSYTPRFFRLSANIAVHPDYIADKVLAAIETALRDRFSFAKRGFGQSVALSEVVATMQNVAGVVAVDLDNLYRSDTLPPAKRNDILFANAPTATDAAELLTLDVQPLNLKLMS